MVRLCYNLLFPLVLLAMLPGFLLRMMRRGNYRHKFGQRFAIYSARTRYRLQQNQGNCLWIHAVSVGEVLIALKFIRVAQHHSQLPVVLSTTTSTGFVLANKHRSPGLEVIYHPVDFWWSVRKAMQLIRPRALIMVEAEVWPNLVAEARAVGAATAIINARLSPRSERRYQWIRPLSRSLFSQLDHVFVQDPSDIDRFIRIGMPAAAIECTGSIKFDYSGEPPVDASRQEARLKAMQIQPYQPILLAASTHPGEEKILTEIFHKLRRHFPDLFLILVPRHAERGFAIEQELAAMGLRLDRVGRKETPRPADILIADTTGELRAWVEVADLVFVGKSLTSTGGQNPAEAVVAGKPVVFGPHMENFAAFVTLLNAYHGCTQVADEAELETALTHLLTHPKECLAIVDRATRALEPHQGATERTWQALEAVT